MKRILIAGVLTVACSGDQVVYKAAEGMTTYRDITVFQWISRDDSTANSSILLPVLSGVPSIEGNCFSFDALGREGRVIPILSVPARETAERIIDDLLDGTGRYGSVQLGTHQEWFELPDEDWDQIVGRCRGATDYVPVGSLDHATRL